MAVIGWLFICLCMFYFSAAYVFIFLDTMGQYNIGGVPNTTKKRVIAIIFGILLTIVWYYVFKGSPFSYVGMK